MNHGWQSEPIDGPKGGWNVDLPIYPSIFLSIYPSICLSICLSDYLSLYLSILLSIYPSSCLSTYLSVYLPIHLSVFPSICFALYLSMQPSTHQTTGSNCVATSKKCLFEQAGKAKHWIIFQQAGKAKWEKVRSSGKNDQQFPCFGTFARVYLVQLFLLG